MYKLILVVSVILAPAILASYCDDWRICNGVTCQSVPSPCPAATPYLLWSECGCCQYCSANPRIGPCGECGEDVLCFSKESTPICTGDNQIVTLDPYCGCCKVCRTLVGEGGSCTATSGNACEADLDCIDGICQ